METPSTHIESPVGEVSSKPSEPKSSQVLELLSSEIIDGTLPPGTSLKEPDLARKYQVGRAPIREALRVLEAKQLVERSPYRTLKVVSLSAKRVGDLYEVRGVLEALACRRAAKLISVEQLTMLKACLLEEHKTIVLRSIDPADLKGKKTLLTFHSKIAQISENQEVFRLLTSDIWRLIGADYRRKVHRPEILRQSHLEHLAIYKALKNRDPDLSELLMLRHIKNTRARREETINGVPE